MWPTLLIVSFLVGVAGGWMACCLWAVLYLDRRIIDRHGEQVFPQRRISISQYIKEHPWPNPPRPVPSSPPAPPEAWE